MSSSHRLITINRTLRYRAAVAHASLEEGLCVIDLLARGQKASEGILALADAAEDGGNTAEATEPKVDASEEKGKVEGMKESLVEVQISPPTQMSATTGDEICCALPDRVDFGNVPIGAVAYRLVVVKNMIDPKLMAALGIPKVGG